RWNIYGSSRARVNHLSSVWGFLDARRRYGRRNPAGDPGTLREQSLSNDVGVSFETGFREQSKQNTHHPFMGRPLASALDARWRISDISRRHPAAPRRSKPCNPAI